MTNDLLIDETNLYGVPPLNIFGRTDNQYSNPNYIQNDVALPWGYSRRSNSPEPEKEASNDYYDDLHEFESEDINNKIYHPIKVVTHPIVYDDDLNFELDNAENKDLEPSHETATVVGKPLNKDQWNVNDNLLKNSFEKLVEKSSHKLEIENEDFVQMLKQILEHFKQFGVFDLVKDIEYKHISDLFHLTADNECQAKAYEDILKKVIEFIASLAKV
jgi:hypothetical protein